MVTKVAFSAKCFGFFKKWTKKCPKLKTENTFGKRKSLKYNKSSKRLKEKKKFMFTPATEYVNNSK
jgi:hypothetical protein